VPYKISLKEFEKTGLDVIFYGQDHFDTMAILQDKSDMDHEEITRRKGEAKLLTNKDLLDKNFSEVIRNLSECEKYVDRVLVSALSAKYDLCSPPRREAKKATPNLAAC
jgi:hypothetical protein